jgi:hypothetical protein
MAFQNIIGANWKISSEFIAAGSASGTLDQVLGNGNNAGFIGMEDVGAILAASVAAPFGGFDELQTTRITDQTNAGLELDPVNGPLIIKGATTKGSILVGNGTETNELAVGAPGLVLKTNPSAALGVEWAVDGTSGITGVSAGPNITIDSITNPLIPAISLSNPLTSGVNFAAVALAGASNDGVIDRQQTINIQTTGGTLAEIKESFNEVSTTRSGFTTLNQTAIVGELDISYLDATANTSSSSKVQAQLNQSGCRFNTINTTSGDNTLREIAILDGAMLDNTTGNNATSGSILARNVFVGGLTNTEFKSVILTDTTANNSYQQTLNSSGSNLLLTTSDAPANYTTSVGINSTKNSSVSCNMISTGTANNRVAFNNSQANASTLEARTEIKCVETGATPLTSDLDLISDSTSCRIQQTYIPNSGVSEFSTITTNSSGLQIVSTNNNMTLIAGGNAKLQGFGSIVDCQATSINSTTQVFQNFSSQSGTAATPNFIFKEAAPTPVGACVIRMDKAVAPTAGNAISAISSYALDGTATSREWSRIQTKVESNGVGNQDGTLSIFNSVNGSVLETFNFNGAQNENNSFRPLDLNGNALRTTSGSMTIDTSPSSVGAVLTLSTKDNVAGSGLGLALTGNTLLSASAGGNSGQHLCLSIGGTVYKIALLNP